MAEQGENSVLSEELCGNPSCECHPQLGKDYCSEGCHLNATEPDHVCQCGHKQCSEAQA